MPIFVSCLPTESGYFCLEAIFCSWLMFSKINVLLSPLSWILNDLSVWE